MNERIKELYTQAVYNSEYVLDTFAEKFAELILLDLIRCINDTQTANKCVYTTFDKSIADCVKNEIIKLIETTYNVKEK